MKDIKVDLKEEHVNGRHILIVEDLFDSGSTIVKTRECIQSFSPASLKFAIFCHKRNPKNLKYQFFADYFGFIIPDYFVVGYGIDYNEAFRDFNHLCVINQKGIEYFKD